MTTKHYKEGAMIPYLGEYWSLTRATTKLKRVKIEFDEGFKAHVPMSLASDIIESEIRRALTKWLRNSAHTQVQAIVNKHQEKHQLRPRSIRIKTQKSRWGSCGIHNDININWLLILAPSVILEYVVVHELCHIQQRNHSARFWALVATHLPDYKQQRLWLHNHGCVLMKGL